jgi:serine carboxypeptidase 1
MAATAQQQIASGQFAAAWSSWNDLLQFIDSKSASVVSIDPLVVTNSVAHSTSLLLPSSSSTSLIAIFAGRVQFLA